MKNLTWQNPEQLFVAQVLINKVKSKCCGIKVKDDVEGEKTFSMGWQAGAKATYKDFSLKVGYEFGLTDVLDGGKSKLNGVYFRLGYSF